MAKKKLDSLTDEMLMGLTPPKAIPLEEAGLGANMIDSDSMAIMVSVIDESKYFYSDAHKKIFESQLRLFRAGDPIDILTVTEDLKKAGELDAIGGAYYLVELTNRVASNANLEYHCRKIKAAWMLRRLISAGYKIKDMAFSLEDPKEIIAYFDKVTIELFGKDMGDEKTLSDLVVDVSKNAKELHERGGEMVGEPLFGELPGLDRLINGAEPGDTIGIYSRPGMGKSSLGNNIVHGAYIRNTPLYFWSGEAPKQKSTVRLISMHTGVHSRLIERGAYFDNGYEEERDKIEKAMLEIGERSNIIFSQGKMNLQIMRSKIISYIKLHGIGVFMFDRVELFEEVINTSDMGKRAAVSDRVTGTARALANEFNVVIILMGQMTKEVEGNTRKKPKMSNMIGGTGVHANFNKVIAPYRPTEYDYSEWEDGSSCEGEAELMILKNNNDPKHNYRVMFDGPCQCFRESGAVARSSVDETPF